MEKRNFHIGTGTMHTGEPCTDRNCITERRDPASGMWELAGERGSRLPIRRTVVGMVVVVVLLSVYGPDLVTLLVLLR